MSNSLAIAAVTATLRNLLIRRLGSELPNQDALTTKPLDKAREPNASTNQVNIFLYHIAYDAAWRNMNMPNQVRPGETGEPPLPLVLSYLITAYGDNSSQELGSQRLLGIAMRAFHDHPLLGADEIAASLAGNDLGDQIERVRITPQPISVDEMSKLWTTFQTNYRISVAYQVSVVLIESEREVRTPLPVLTPEISVQPFLTPPFATLASIALPKKRPSALLGDTVVFEGVHLDGDSVEARFKHPRLEEAIPVPALAGGTATKVSVTIPAGEPEKWATGVYSVSLLIRRPGKPDRVSNALPFVLGTKITSALPMTVARDGAGNATVDLTCSPQVLPEQRAVLLLSDDDSRQVQAEPHPNKTDQLRFIIKDAPLSTADGFFVRLRVDGVDSLLITDYEARPPIFDPDQRLEIT